MIVDTSAIVAVILREPEAEQFETLIAAHLYPRLSAGSWVELAAIMTRRLHGAHDENLDRLMTQWRLEIAPVTTAQAHIARVAYRTYGIGSGHPARLNFGDCFSYALAKETGEPLLFKGDDFSRTDIAAAVRADGR